MRQMMEGVTMPGTAPGTRKRGSPDTGGGKTGSAQIFDFATHHYTHSYNGSFMGFAPVTNPSIVVVVTVNGTHGSGGYGGRAAGARFPRGGDRSLARTGSAKGYPGQIRLPQRW